MNAVQPSSRIHPDASVAVVAKVLLSHHLKQVRSRLKLAAHFADADIEDVHQLRIATRRSIAALDVFRKYLDPDRRRRIVVQLKRIRRVAANARDLDVLIQQQSSVSLKDRSLTKQLKKRRKKVQRPIISAYKELNRKNKFRKDCRKLIESLGDNKKSHRHSFRKCAGVKLQQSLDEFFERRPGDVTNLKQLHRFRIAAKHFRYRLEVVELAFPPQSFSRITKDMKRLQDILGKLNDHDVAIKRFREMKSKGHKIRRRVIEGELEGLQQSKASFAAWWTPEKAACIGQKIDLITSEFSGSE